MKYNIAEFKRRMTVGSQWEFVADWCPSPVVRKCTVSQSNSFALTHPTKADPSSLCDWPKAGEVTFINNNDGVFALRIDHETGFLVYRHLENK